MIAPVTVTALPLVGLVMAGVTAQTNRSALTSPVMTVTVATA